MPLKDYVVRHIGTWVEYQGWLRLFALGGRDESGSLALCSVDVSVLPETSCLCHWGTAMCYQIIHCIRLYWDIIAPQSSNLGKGKPRCLHTQCRVNWIELIYAHWTKRTSYQSTFMWGCPRVRTTTPDIWIASPLDVWLRSGKFKFQPV